MDFFLNSDVTVKHDFYRYVWTDYQSGLMDCLIINLRGLHIVELGGINHFSYPAMALEATQFGQAGIQRVLAAFEAEPDWTFARALALCTAAGSFAMSAADTAAGAAGSLLLGKY